MRNRARPDTAAHDIAALKTRLDFVEAQMRNIDMQRHVSWPPFDSPATAPFMQFSTCSVTEFLHQFFEPVVQIPSVCTYRIPSYRRKTRLPGGLRMPVVTVSARMKPIGTR